MLWLLDEQEVEHSEVARVIEKPWAYEDWLAIYRRVGRCPTSTLRSRRV